MSSAPTTFYDTLNTHYSYLLGLVPYTATDSGNVTKVTQATAAKLTDYNNLTQANIGEQNNVLTQQEDVIRILEREKTRLDTKKSSVDTILEGQRRMIDLNTSYASRYRAYNRVMMFFAFIVVLLFIYYALGAFLPAAVVTTLVVLTLAVAIIVTYYMVMDIMRRDRLNFDKIDSAQLMQPGRVKSAVNTYNSFFGDVGSNLMGALNQCVGPVCCASGTYYDVSSGTCLVGTDAGNNPFLTTGPEISAFSNLAEAYTIKDIPMSLNAVGAVGTVETFSKNPLDYGKF